MLRDPRVWLIAALVLGVLAVRQHRTATDAAAPPWYWPF